MAKSKADKDTELRLACQAAIGGADEKVILAIRAASYRGVSGKSRNLAPSLAKPMVLAVCVIETRQRASAFLRVFQHSTAGVFELKPVIKVYKLKYLSTVEVMTNDPSGCSFLLGFDKVRHQSVASSQWTAYNIDDRNLLLLCILKTCKDMVGRIPRVFGVDIVQMALWLKERETTSCNQESSQLTTMMSESDLNVTVQNELASQAEEEDMQALLDFYVMGIGEAEAFSDMLKREFQALEAANVHDILAIQPLIDEVLQGLDTAMNYTSEMDEWLSTFNVKLKFMRDDIESVETLNNSLELQTVNCKALDEELGQLLEKLNIPSEYSACLTKGSFDEANMPKIMEACEWLNRALSALEVPKLDTAYINMRAVKVKKVEFKKLKTTFVGRASEFIKRYLTNLVDYMIRDKHQLSTRHDHKHIHSKCSAYTELVLHLKQLDKNCLGPLREAYCTSFNLLLRRESREFANELRTSSEVSRNPISWFDAYAGSAQTKRNTDTSAVSDAYAKMLTNFIPHLEQEISFFAEFMCFDTEIMETNNAEVALLNHYLQELLDGIQEDFYSIIEWGNKIDPLRCVSMNGITAQSLSAQRPNATKFVVALLTDLQSRTGVLFTRFVEEFCRRIEITENALPASGVHSHIHRFTALATFMERCIQGQCRDLADTAYTKIGSTLFMTLNKIARADPKYGDVFLLENYAAFQTSLYELANLVPALAKLYQQASDAYEQACTRYVHMIIYSQFEQLFQYATKIEDLITTNKPEEIRSTPGMSTTDLRRVLKLTSSEIDRSINAMYKALQRNLTLKELVRPLHIRFKKEFMSKSQAVVELVGNIYPTETKWMPSVAQVRDLLASIEEAYFL